ncbi:MAG: HRDC domain-containing protein [Anaerolineales bacterium]
MTTASKRLPEFDVLRTVAILLLLVHHSGFYSLDLGLNLQVLSPFFEAFLLGCFFFISGYFTETSLQRSEGDLRRFFLSRFIKVYPPYLIALALFLSVLGITLRERFDLFVYAAGLQFVFADMVKPILTLWYVGAILLFYVLFGLLWKFAPKTTFLVFIASVLFVLALLAHKVGGLFDARFFKYYFVFLTGMLTARHAEPSGVLSSRYLLLKVLAALIGIRVFSLASSGEPVSLAYIAASYTFIVSAVILLFAVIAKLSIISALCHSRDAIAEKLDRPPFKVIDDNLLLEIAKRMPEQDVDLADIGLSTKQIRLWGGEMIAAAVGRRLRWLNLEQPKRPSDAVMRRVEKLKAWRKKVAQELKVESDIVLPKLYLGLFAENPPKSLHELETAMKDSPRRFQIYGTQILGLFGG